MHFCFSGRASKHWQRAKRAPRGEPCVVVKAAKRWLWPGCSATFLVAGALVTVRPVAWGTLRDKAWTSAYADQSAPLFELVESVPEREADALPGAQIRGEIEQRSAVLLAHPPQLGFRVAEPVNGARGMRVHMGL